VAAAGVAQVSDEGALAETVARILEAHPAEIERLRAGEAKLIGFFVGQVMREVPGANPKMVNELIGRSLP
jgi:Asp-tRNA(Asn)/Glu-tRNA(Gln) amidotransferase B subunit